MKKPNLPISVEPLKELSLSDFYNKHKEIISILANPELKDQIITFLYKNKRERFLESILSKSYKPSWLVLNTRKVFFDIETLYLPNDADIKELYLTGSTNYISKQRLGIAVSINDKGEVKQWKETSVPDLIKYLLSYDEIVSYNGLAFDLQVLANYISNPAKAQELYNKSFDLMLYTEMVRGKRRSLDDVGIDIIGKGKLNKVIDSKNVPAILRNGSEEEVQWAWQYCFNDVAVMREVYEKLNISLNDKIRFGLWQLDNVHQQITSIIDRSIINLLNDLDKQPEENGIKGQLDELAGDFNKEWNNVLQKISQYITGLPEEELVGYLFHKGPSNQIASIIEKTISESDIVSWARYYFKVCTPNFTSGIRSFIDCSTFEGFNKWKLGKIVEKFLPTKTLIESNWLNLNMEILKLNDYPIGLLIKKDSKQYIFLNDLNATIFKLDNKDILKKFDEAETIFFNYMNQWFEKKKDQYAYSAKLKKVEFDHLIDLKFIERKVWPDGSKLSDFVKKTISDTLPNLIQKCEEKIPEILEIMAEHHIGELDNMLQKLEKLTETEWYKNIKQYKLEYEYTLLYFIFLKLKKKEIPSDKLLEFYNAGIDRLRKQGLEIGTFKHKFTKSNTLSNPIWDIGASLSRISYENIAGIS